MMKVKSDIAYGWENDDFNDMPGSITNLRQLMTGDMCRSQLEMDRNKWLGETNR